MQLQAPPAWMEANLPQRLAEGWSGIEHKLGFVRLRISYQLCETHTFVLLTRSWWPQGVCELLGLGSGKGWSWTKLGKAAQENPLCLRGRTGCFGIRAFVIPSSPAACFQPDPDIFHVVGHEYHRGCVAVHGQGELEPSVICTRVKPTPGAYPAGDSWILLGTGQLRSFPLSPALSPSQLTRRVFKPRL